MRDTTFADPRDHVLPTLDETHALVGVAPEGDASLRYQIVVPRGWARARAVGQGAASPRAPQLIGLFAKDPAEPHGPRIMVTVERLRFDVPPRQLVTERWEASGWRIGVSRPVDNGRFEIGGLRDMGKYVEVRRSTGFVDGARLVRVDVAAPLPVWPAVHDLLWPCGPLMLLKEPTYQRAVEPRRRHAAGGMQVSLPESWAARWVSDDTALVATTAVSDDASVLVRPDMDLGELADDCRHAMAKYGMAMSRVGAAVRPIEAQPPGVVLSRYGCAVPQGHPPRELYVGHQAVAGRSVAYAAVVTQRPCWARFRTLRALQIAIETTKEAP